MELFINQINYDKLKNGLQKVELHNFYSSEEKRAEYGKISNPGYKVSANLYSDLLNTALVMQDLLTKNVPVLTKDKCNQYLRNLHELKVILKSNYTSNTPINITTFNKKQINLLRLEDDVRVFGNELLDDDKAIIFIAAFLHDITKLFCLDIDKKSKKIYQLVHGDIKGYHDDLFMVLKDYYTTPISFDTDVLIIEKMVANYKKNDEKKQIYKNYLQTTLSTCLRTIFELKNSDSDNPIKYALDLVKSSFNNPGHFDQAMTLCYLYGKHNPCDEYVYKALGNPWGYWRTDFTDVTTFTRLFQDKKKDGIEIQHDLFSGDNYESLTTYLQEQKQTFEDLVKVDNSDNDPNIIVKLFLLQLADIMGANPLYTNYGQDSKQLDVSAMGLTYHLNSLYKFENSCVIDTADIPDFNDMGSPFKKYNSKDESKPGIAIMDLFLLQLAFDPKNSLESSMVVGGGKRKKHKSNSKKSKKLSKQKKGNHKNPFKKFITQKNNHFNPKHNKSARTHKRLIGGVRTKLPNNRKTKVNYLEYPKYTNIIKKNDYTNPNEIIKNPLPNKLNPLQIKKKKPNNKNK